jgi:hypothetical protein
MQRVPCALIIALLLALAGCIVLPVPMPPRGTQVDVEAAKMVIGETTRAEVQALLGSPNRLAFGHREVWELDRDPAHMVFVIVAGGPGAAFVGGTRTGEAGVRRYVVEVAYDEAGLVLSWQWIAADGSGTASDGASSAAPAARPESLLSLRADRVFFEGRDRACSSSISPNPAAWSLSASRWRPVPGSKAGAGRTRPAERA